MNRQKIAAFTIKMNVSLHVRQLTFRSFGITFIILSLLLNPYVIERIIIPDRHYENIKNIDLLFLSETILFLFTYILSWSHIRRGLARTTLVIISIILSIYCIESISCTLLAQNSCTWTIHPQDNTKHLYDDTDYVPDLGYVLKKNNTFHPVKRNANGTIIYDVVYTTDQYRRRIIKEASASSFLNDTKHIILFGCSYTFGEGLNDENTLQYYLGKNASGYQVYNYAVHGYGPQSMLALLEKGKMPSEIPSREGVAIYVYIEGHMNRLIGSTKTPWITMYPYYNLNADDVLIRNGNFWTGRPMRTYFYDKYEAAYAQSSFLQLIGLNFPLRIRDDDVKLMYRVIEKSKELYERQFDGKFYVLIHPLTERTVDEQALVVMLKKNGIPVIETLIANNAEYRIPDDSHSNGLLNKILADYLFSYFRFTR